MILLAIPTFAWIIIILLVVLVAGFLFRGRF